MSKLINILHIITDLPIGGAQYNTIYTVEKLNYKKYNISLACNCKGEMLDKVKIVPNLNLIDVPFLTRDINLIKDFKAFLSIFRLIRRGKYHIVHTHSSKPGAIGTIAAWLNKTPVIIHTLHGFPFNEFMGRFTNKIYTLLEKFWFYFCDKIITVSQLNKEKAIKIKLATREKLINIYSGIDMDQFDKISSGDLKKELGLPDNYKLIGSVGRLSHQKDPICFIKSIPLVLKKIKKIHFVLTGDGPLREILEKFIIQYKLSEHVSLIGNRDDIPNVLKSLDVFVLSSLYEGLGRSLTEAMYCKLPIVATEVEGVPELINHMKTGYLVQPRDHYEIAKGLLFCLRNNTHAKSMACNAHKLVKNKFHVLKMIDRIDSLYQAYI